MSTDRFIIIVEIIVLASVVSLAFIFMNRSLKYEQSHPVVAVYTEKEDCEIVGLDPSLLGATVKYKGETYPVDVDFSDSEVRIGDSLTCSIRVKERKDAKPEIDMEVYKGDSQD